ncbi:hypothetical protein GGI35DRAFT_461336 [Trichoderma velutinum]
MVKHFDLLPFLCFLTFLGTLNQNLTTQQPCRNSSWYSVLRTHTDTQCTHGTTAGIVVFLVRGHSTRTQYVDGHRGERSISQRLFSEKVPTPKRTPRKGDFLLRCNLFPPVE